MFEQGKGHPDHHDEAGNGCHDTDEKFIGLRSRRDAVKPPDQYRCAQQSERITREQIIRLAKAAPAEPESFWRAFIVGLAREGQKFKRYGKLALIALVISLVFGFIPGVAPITWATITAWWLTFEYADYFSDNVGEPLGTTLRLMHEHKRLSIGFGFTALLGTMIPVVNLLIVPACVIGATLWRIDVYQSQN